MKKPNSVLVALLIFIAGLGALTLKLALDKNSLLAPYLGEMSSGLIVGGMLSILYKLVAEKEQKEELRKLFNIHRSVEEAGLDQVLSATQQFNYQNFLEKNSSVTIVMNDGQRWVGTYSVALKNRFSRHGTETKFYTLDPQGAHIEALSKKLGVTEAKTQEKITDAHRMLLAEWDASEKKGKLIISVLNNFPTHSVFLGDEDAVVSLYQISSGRTQVPVFIAKDVKRRDSFFDFILKDMDKLVGESKCKEQRGFA